MRDNIKIETGIQRMNINAIIANTGNGNVTTGNISTGDIQQKICIDNEQRKEFLLLLEEMMKEAESLNDSTAAKAVVLIQDETKKESWNKKIIKFALDTIQKTAVTLAAQGLSLLVSKAIALLPLL